MVAATTEMTDHELLRNIPLFSKLTDQERTALASRLKGRAMPANEPIFWIGERGDEMFIVQHGKVRLSYTDEAGSDVTLAVLAPGAFFGDLSLLDGGPRTATARAQTDATLLSLDRHGFYDFIEKHPSAAIHMIATLGQRNRDTLDKLRGVRNVNEQVEQTTTSFHRLVDRAASIAATGKFLFGTLSFVAIWIVIQTVLTMRYRPELIKASGFPVDSPPYFFWLGFMASLISFLLTVFVLNSQRRHSERDRIRADMEYQVNLKAQLEVMQLHQKIDRLTALVEGPGANGDGPGSSVTADPRST
jgi:uncharacterized membrane protein